MHITWDEFKKKVDEFLTKENRTGEIELTHISFTSSGSSKVRKLKLNVKYVFDFFCFSI